MLSKGTVLRALLLASAALLPAVDLEAGDSCRRGRNNDGYRDSYYRSPGYGYAPNYGYGPGYVRGPRGNAYGYYNRRPPAVVVRRAPPPAYAAPYGYRSYGYRPAPPPPRRVDYYRR